MSKSLALTIPVTNVSSLKIPGTSAKESTCYVAIPDIPSSLGEYVSINPRRPITKSDGRVTSGKGSDIIDTLLNCPEKMSTINRGVRLFVERCKEGVNAGGQKNVALLLTNTDEHGIIDGLHTYLSCLYVINQINGNAASLRKGKVKFTIVQGTDKDEVPNIAEGLNSSYQIDRRSIINLKLILKPIETALYGCPGAETITYYQGDEGTMSVLCVIGMLNLMDVEKYNGVPKANSSGHPIGVYRQTSNTVDRFEPRCKTSLAYANMIDHLPDFIRLWDQIHHDIPIIYNQNGGRYKGLSDTKELKSPAKLPFIQSETKFLVPNGWIIPIFSAFRANAVMSRNKFRWKKPLHEVYAAVIAQLILHTMRTGKDTTPSECGRNAGLFSTLFATVESRLSKMK